MNVTNKQIKALSDEAGAAGDLAMVKICRRALDGDQEARKECERVISEWAAERDGGPDGGTPEKRP